MIVYDLQNLGKIYLDQDKAAKALRQPLLGMSTGRFILEFAVLAGLSMVIFHLARNKMTWWGK